MEYKIEEYKLENGIEGITIICLNTKGQKIMMIDMRDKLCDREKLKKAVALRDEEIPEELEDMELWYTVEEYRTDKLDKPLIGSIVINHLVSLGYILQLDYKEDIEDYVDHMKNYWKDGEVKLIRFELDNDQDYYAKVPVSCNLQNVYEAKIYE